MKTPDLVTVVHGDSVVQVPINQWKLIMNCAGQMIDDNHHLDYFRGKYTVKTLDGVQKFYEKLSSV